MINFKHFDSNISTAPANGVDINKGNNKITEHRSIFQRESQNS